MSESLSNAEKDVFDTLSNFQAQLEATFKDNQIIQDYALLNGFLSFVDSKLTRMVNESLNVQQERYEEARRTGSLDIDIDDRTVPLILRLYWEKICHPIFKWFQAWRKMISPKERGEKPRYVEFRKMNAKLAKFFKSAHKFYYSIMEQVVSKYDCSAVMPLKLREELNLRVPDSAQQTGLDTNGKMAVLVVVTLHNCLLYLGTTHRYKIVGEKISNRYQRQDFEKSIRYLDMACLFLPSMGEAHLQKGLIYVQTNDFGSAVYQFTRSALARIPSPAAESNFATLISDRKSRLRYKFDQNLKEISRQEMDRNKIINKEVIESYFLILFGNHFAPQSWRLDGMQGFSNLDSLERVLNEKISTRYLKNIELIFENLIVTIGGFDLLLRGANSGEQRFDPLVVSLKNFSQNHLNYLSFAFKFISHILHVIREAWEKNFNDFHYLGMVRVIEGWLKSNRAALQYAHRDENFCKALALLLNDILRSDMFDKSFLSENKPTRPYFFEEDVILREFSTLRYSLSDFNDEDIFASNEASSRLMGYVPDGRKLEKSDEATLRLKAIVSSGGKFFVKNDCGIVWNAQRTLYEFGQPIMKRLPKKPLTKAQGEKRAPKTKKFAKGEALSLAELEEQLTRNRQGSKAADWGYSGSSAPMAPSTINTKPSSGMTELALARQANTVSSEGSVQHSSSSTTLSSFSSRSDEKNLMELSAKQGKGNQEPISAEFLEKQHKHQNMESFSSTSPSVGMPPYGPPGIAPIGYGVPFVQAQATQPVAAASMVYPNGQPPMVSAVYPGSGQPIQMYQPSAWMAQPYYQQGAYLYGAPGSQQPHYPQGTMYGAAQRSSASSATDFAHH